MVLSLSCPLSLNVNELSHVTVGLGPEVACAHVLIPMELLGASNISGHYAL